MKQNLRGRWGLSSNTHESEVLVHALILCRYFIFGTLGGRRACGRQALPDMMNRSQSCLPKLVCNGIKVELTGVEPVSEKV